MREGLLPFERDAVGRVIEHSVRASGSSDHLSTHLVTLGDTLRESDYRAREAGRTAVSMCVILPAVFVSSAS